MVTPPAEEHPQRKRRFRIQSEFGNARQWRSRKNRPCDICRKRKTACVIENQPPCLFCKARGLDCTSSPDYHKSQPSASSPDADQDEESQSALQPSPELEVEVEHIMFDNISPTNSETEHAHNLLRATMGEINLHDQVEADHPRTPGKDDSQTLEAFMRTLEDNKDQTAHSMGLSGEQDTNLLSSFRSVIINERNLVAGDIIHVYPGSEAAGTPPLHFSLLSDLFMPYDDQLKNECSQSIESKVGAHGADLVRLYFKHVHPVYCVVSKVRFLRAYKEDKLSIPASLRGVMYGLGLIFWNQDQLLREEARPCKQWELFQFAQTSLERELEAPNLWKMQACLLMLHERAAGNSIFETPRTWTLSAQAVACAQMIGLHHDPSEWNIAPWEKSLRKKLWWATYTTDMWASVSHGNPTHIYKASYTMSDLNLEDLRFDEDVPDDLRELVDEQNVGFEISTAVRFLELVKLTRELGNLLDTAYFEHCYRAAVKEPQNQEERLLRIQSQLNAWHSLIPQCVTMNYTTSDYQFYNNGPLHLAYHATQVLLFRALMTPASVAAKNNPQSTLRRYFTAAIDQLRCFLKFTHEVNLSCLQSFWGRHARSQFILIGNFIIYLFLLSSTPAHVRETFRLLELFYESLQRIHELVDEDSVGLIRPVALRIDSFFTQAAQTMRGSVTSQYKSHEMLGTPQQDPDI